MKTKNKSGEIIVCKNCQIQLNKITEAGLLSGTDLTTLENPARVINVNFPVEMDNGSTRLVSGFRIQYNDVLGPTKGGVRAHQESNAEEVAELAFLMSLKCSLAGLPYGGAKGAIKINPKELSEKEFERVVRGFGKAISRFIGPDYDIPAPDVNTGPREMSLIRDEYEKYVGQNSPAVITGKAVEDEGSLGRDSSTSRGGFYVLEEHLKNKNPSEVKIAIQGFGNVGSHLARILSDDGYKIVAVSDSKTGIHNPEGLNISELIDWKKNRSPFTERPEEKISNEALLELDVDVLVPAALGAVITAENAKNIKAKTILEMANAPITPGADSLLKEMNITVIPDILANAGGVIVSYFEWKQNKTQEKWTLERVNTELKKYILDAYKKTIAESKEKEISLRSASYSVAIKRILKS